MSTVSPDESPIASTSLLKHGSDIKSHSSPAVIATSDQVLYELSLARDAELASDESWQDATSTSLEWILSLHAPTDDHHHLRPADHRHDGEPVQSDSKSKGKGKEHALVHWYCGDHGAKACWQPSVFLIRLLSMRRQGDVAVWRDAFDRLLLECPRCVSAFQHAKSEFIERYLSVRKSDAAIRGFVDGIERLEKQRVVQAFADAGVSRSVIAAHLAAAKSPPVTLASVPPSVVQNCLVNHLLFQDDAVVELLASGLPLSHPIELPHDVTPGLLALRFHQRADLRCWAQQQLDICELVNSRDYTHRGLRQIVEAHLDLLASRDRGDFHAETVIELPYVDSRVEFWQALGSTLTLLDSDTIRANLSRSALQSAPRGDGSTPQPAGRFTGVDIVQVVASHLGDTEDHFSHVLSCLRIVLDRLGRYVWSEVADRFEEVMLHAILDNATFERLFVGARIADSARNDDPIVNWIPPFLSSVAASSTRFTNTLAIFGSTFLERFQALRFEAEARTRALVIAATIFSDVFFDVESSASGGLKWPYAAEAAKTLDLHAPAIARFAFDIQYDTALWQKAGTVAREFAARLMQRDARRVRDAIYALGSYTLEAIRREEQIKREAQRNVTHPSTKSAPEDQAQTSAAPPAVSYCSSLWSATYEVLRPTDQKGLAVVILGTGPVCHLEPLSARTWVLKDRLRPQMKAVNTALDQMRQPLLLLLASFTEEPPEVLLETLARPGMTDILTAWLVSPVEDVNSAAQGFIKQAFDVLTRRACFSALLMHHPDSTIKGLLRSIRSFKGAASVLPEDCGQAKRLVRCLSDVIDALCATTNGLLRDSAFAAHCADHMNDLGSVLYELWRRMCDALALVFKQTPSWSAFFENAVMTEWMRDAILFGVDLLRQEPTFATAIASSRREVVGDEGAQQNMMRSRRFIAALSEPLEELTAWLRLNDEELLSATFDLVRAMLSRFREAGIELRSSTAARLRKIADSNRRNSAKPSNILRDDQLRDLVDALTANDGEDDVVIIDGNQASKHRVHKPGMSVLDRFESRMRPTGSRPQSAAASVRSRSAAYANGKVTSSTPSNKVAGPARPRGVPWTTYTSKSSRAFSSDDSSSDDDDGSGADSKPSGLALLARAQKSSPKIKRTTERRTIKMLEEVGAGNAGKRGRGPAIGIGLAQDVAQRRAANMARLRGPPDFSSLYRYILQWDLEQDRELPPNFDSPLRPLKSSFADADEYSKYFEPLLLTECWEQVRTAKADSMKDSLALKMTIAGRQAVDDFVDVFVTIDHSSVPRGAYLSETDLVLIRQGSHQTLAKVQSFARKRNFFEATLRTHLGNDVTDAGPGLVARAQWQAIKLCSMSTVHREHSALQSIRYLDLFHDIVSPRPAPRIPFDARNLSRIASTYDVNEPQAKAIQGALQTSGFSLVQGPPGTGKTKTILGLIGAFMDARPRSAAPIVVGQATNELDREPTAKVLLCAPSNAAVDEVAKRLKDGIRGSSGRVVVPKVVRIGSEAAVDISVKDIHLDELVECALGGGGSGLADTANNAQSKMQAMRTEIDTLRASRDEKLAALQAINENEALRDELRYQLKTVKSQIFEISQRLDVEKDKAQQSRRAMDAHQRKMRMQILTDADVICATLSGAGHDYMAQLPFDFETVIIDEAAQSVELSSLIPLKYGCRRCILVGDPLQLPPTVISSAATKAGYERSLFVRLMERGHESYLLSIQYRMHPHISAFPSAAFYQSRLLDGDGMSRKTAQPWHASPFFPPYSFFHVCNGIEIAGRGHSWTNPQEAQTALAIYERLLKDYPSIDLNYRIGMVTPYKGQVWELKTAFRRRFGDEILSKISFNTVDGFQGQEKDIIVLSCVRGGSVDRGVGFLADTRRMNVALTRARSSLFILGDANKLRSNKYWANLVEDAEARGLLMQVDPGHFRSLQTIAPPAVRATVPASRSVAKCITATSVTASPAVTPSTVPPRQLSKRAVAGPSSSSPDSLRADVRGVKRVSKAIGANGNDDPSKKSRLDLVAGSSSNPTSLAEVKNDPDGSRAPTGAHPLPSVARPRPKPSIFIQKKRPVGGQASRKP